MENLPLVVLKELFEMMKANPTDLINCSRVCKNWQAAYETMIVKPDRLFLHFDAFIPLNYRLYHTGEAVAKTDFIKIPNDLRFLSSDAARIHFANIRKLIIFPTYIDHEGHGFCEFNFQEQLSHFESLEHFEIHYRHLLIENDQIDLPKLRVLCFKDCDFSIDCGQLTLNTPSLKVLAVFPGAFERWSIVNFNILFPQQLRHLRIVLPAFFPGYGFKFGPEYANLECLVAENEIATFQGDPEVYRKFNQLGEDFLEPLSNLKFFFISQEEFDLARLRAEKVKFNRKDLNILDHKTDPFFHYEDWQRHVEHQGQLSSWPERFILEFGKLVNCRIPFRHFENYLPILVLEVRQVTNQPLLVQFLRNVKIKNLTLDYDFNLGQSFFEEIADFLTVHRLYSFTGTWENVSDLSVLSRMNFLEFDLNFDRLPHQLVRKLLRKPSCLMVNFKHYSGFDDEIEEENRQYPNFTNIFGHHIKRIQNKFFCGICRWASSRDANCSEDPIEGTIRHIESERSARNMTEEENANLFSLAGMFAAASKTLPNNL